jgi:ORF6N domain-containing protein
VRWHAGDSSQFDGRQGRTDCSRVPKTRGRGPVLQVDEQLAQRIYVVRGVRVMLDADLALLYGVPTGRLNESVRRNASRFPADFMFRLSRDEEARLMSQFAISIRGNLR